MTAKGRVRIALAVVLVAYTVLTGYLIHHHEPWRDEADAWLTAGWDSIPEVWHRAGYSGTPVLWYLVQMPFAKLGMPYETQAILNFALMVATAALVLWRSPMPVVTRVMIVLSYYFTYEYGVIARNYGLATLLLLLVAEFDRVRAQRPLLYGTLILLLASTCAHFFLVAGVFVLVWAWDVRKAPRDKRVLLGLAIAATGVVLAFVQLLPPADGQMAPGFFSEWNPKRFGESLRRALFPLSQEPWRKMTANTAVVLFFIYLWKRSRRASWLFLGCYAGLAYVYVFKYVGGLRHYGLMFGVILVALWVAERDTVRAGLTRWRLAAYGAMTACWAVTAVDAIPIYQRETSEKFSLAIDMAAYLRASGNAGRVIAAHVAPEASAVLPYLGSEKQFFYAGIAAFGTHMLWDQEYVRGGKFGMEEAVEHVKARFPDWNDPKTGPLVLLNVPLRNPVGLGYRLLYATEGQPYGAVSEKYWLYGPSGM